MVDEERKHLFFKILDKAKKNDFSICLVEHCCRGYGEDHHASRCFAKIFTTHDFCKAFWGDAPMYLIDTSPDWAHDMGDTEFTWVTEKQLKDYCKAELEAYYEEHPSAKDIPTAMVSIITDKWEDPFRFAIMELPAWQHYLQEMVLGEDPIRYLERFL